MRRFCMSPAMVAATFATMAAHSPTTARVPAEALAKAGDIDGVWAFSTLTPLERTAEFSAKPTLTPEEAAAFEKRTIERNDRDRRDSSSPDADVASAYNEFWWDRGTHVANVHGRLLTPLVTEQTAPRTPPLPP